ncbi:MAG: aminoacyl-tRNA deacylase [Planctomycetota bacterium]|jgi:Ala-tRNA(Pro) deacylase
MPVAGKLKAFLDEHKVGYHVLTHHERFTSPEIAQALHVPGQEMAKVVMVKVNGKLVMGVLTANLRVDLGAFADVLKVKKAELATEKEFQGTFPDCEVGAMPPFGNLYDVEVYVDSSLTKDREIVFEAGNHKEAIKLPYETFARLVKPRVADFAAK